MQETAHSEPREQLPADFAISFWRTNWADPAGAEGEPSGVPPRGTGRVSAAKEEWPGGGGGPVQHTAPRSQRAAVEGRQGAGLRRSSQEKI